MSIHAAITMVVIGARMPDDWRLSAEDIAFTAQMAAMSEPITPMIRLQLARDASLAVPSNGRTKPKAYNNGEPRINAKRNQGIHFGNGLFIFDLNAPDEPRR